MTALRTRARATTGDALLVTRRRTRQDAGLLLGTALLLAVTLLALLAVPRLLERTAVDALRTTVTSTGLDAAVVAKVPAQPGAVLSFTGPLAGAASLDTQVPGMRPAIAVATSLPYRATVDDTAFTTRLVVMDTVAGAGDPVRWTAGRAPQAVVLPDPGDPEPAPVPDVEVGLSSTGAQLLGIDPAGGPVSVRLADPEGVHEAWVTGTFEPVDPDDPRWAIATDLLEPAPVDPGADVVAAVALHVPPVAAGDMARVMSIPRLPGSAVAFVDTDRLAPADVPGLRRGVVTYLTQHAGASSGLPDVLDAFEAHAGATRAQASLVLAGVGATAACCLVLAAGLLAQRRGGHLAGERARGASLGSVALRGALEALPLACVAASAAGVAVALWLPGAAGPTPAATVLTTVAAAAPAVLAAHTARTAWTGRRLPADRRERARLAGLRRGRRVVAELVTAVVAVLALVSLRGRGLVADGGSDADPLLVSTPFLLAVAASLAVVHVAPAVVRAASGRALRSRGLAAPLALARAGRAATALAPLVTVTVAVALMVLCGVLAQNVREGQLVAADRLVGADVRIDGELGTPSATAALDSIASADGVTALATGAQSTDRTIGRGGALAATVLVVDAADLARVRAATGLPVDPGLAELGEPAGDRVRALVAEPLLARLQVANGVPLRVTKGSVELDVRGTTSLSPDGGAPPVDARAADLTRTADDGVVVVDATALAAAAESPPATTRAWVAGPGAAQAVADSGIADLPEVTVTTRDGWHDAWSRAPLPAALTVLLLAAVGALALLAVVGLVLVVVATSGERGRTLSTLRTLGLDGRTARWATLGELAPLALGGLLGGTAVGLALPVLVGDALGLAWVTAAPGHVPVVLVGWPVLLAAAAVAVALLVAVLVEQAVRRRERLGDVLRVGAR
ncbi:FtsX-like permease family protein [Cellulomonas wangsupingiae]|uniref:ABC3 transporter permease C-terminal domain-containing protein n=1 Tax=Cellulomonas wangsupingiae TaxID=2968085 RepID=A0ABY5K9K0_9CELL|nr:FtsX-like permease family protein [Cellulomonas wangsupingiae]MCC2334404.1 hypothetical protein [Cellulomonas wangsupingiae]UUI66071.1 hypothetical protein NP075_04915 [Cellulomonas wangsupingiae]